MSAAASSLRARSWAPLLVVSVVCNGLAAGIWKHTATDVRTFCVLFVTDKVIVNGGLWAWRGRRSLSDRASRPFLSAALLAAVLNGLAWIAYFIAFERGPLAMVQTITSAYTAVAAVLALLFLREHLSRAQAAGVALVVAAGMVSCYAAEAPAVGGHGLGWLWASFAAAATWGAASVVAKHAYGLPRADDPRFFLAHTLGLAITILPYGLSRAPAEPRGMIGAAATLAVVLLYVAADLGFFAAVARGPASIVNPLAGLYPMVSIAYAVLVLGDAPDPLGILCLAMVLPGVMLAVPGAMEPMTLLWARLALGSRRDRG